MLMMTPCVSEGGWMVRKDTAYTAKHSAWHMHMVNIMLGYYAGDLVVLRII